ncbi:MAG: hypothetical protein ACLP59_05980 [Bryobacteraceae bacterium]
MAHRELIDRTQKLTPERVTLALRRVHAAQLRQSGRQTGRTSTDVAGEAGDDAV